MRKKILYVILLLMFSLDSDASSSKDTIITALLIIDIQNFYFPGEGPGLVNADKASFNAGEVLNIFREEKQLIIHVRHRSKKGFEIHKSVTPAPGEQVITKDEVNCFKGTDLHQYLKSNNVNQLVIIGMQTHMCLEAAVRAAHDLGFKCIVIEDACATRDLQYGDLTIKAKDVHNSTLATFTQGGYSIVIDIKQFRADPDKYIF
jgi:nicotinamidase-related amidase